VRLLRLYGSERGVGAIGENREACILLDNHHDLTSQKGMKIRV